MSDSTATLPFIGDHLTCIRGERVVFAGLDFRVDPGDALVLIGPNGSGKSSLLRLMAGLLRPAMGQIRWGDEEAQEDREAHNRHIHYVGHHDAVKPVLTVAENIAFWAGIKANAHDAEANLRRALAVFDIERLHDVPGRFLSAGQKRRVNLARIIAAPAPLWLLDEPTTALDKATIARLEAAMREHREGGGMVVVSTHQDIELSTPKAAKVLDIAPFAKARHDFNADDDLWEAV